MKAVDKKRDECQALAVGGECKVCGWKQDECPEPHQVWQPQAEPVLSEVDQLKAKVAELTATLAAKDAELEKLKAEAE